MSNVYAVNNVVYFVSTTGQRKAIELPNGVNRTTVEDAVRAAGIGMWSPDEHQYFIEGELVDGDDHVDAGETITASKNHSNGIVSYDPGTVTFVSTTGATKIIEIPGPTALEDVVRAAGIGIWNTSHVYNVNNTVASARTLVYAGQTIVASKSHSNGTLEEIAGLLREVLARLDVA